MILKAIQTISAPNTEYPYNVIAFETLHFTQPVTFLTGDNGSGKSTLLRILKELSTAIDIGHGRPFSESIRRELPNHFTLAWQTKSQRGFYLQSEDFINYIEWAKSESAFYHDELAAVERKHTNKQSMGYLLESGLQRGNAQHMDAITENVGNASHGEGYLEFFKTRLRDNALYLLDEPETPLSFHGQLALMTMIHEASNRGCQFIICTHSPILLAFPGATIYHFNHTIEAIRYDQHPIVTNTRMFLEDPQRTLHYLFKDNK
ncbi:AAA family ATPase [Erysipelothrix sp. HDW6C]|uniref:ATP-binding cassette domain-containing protein n=1 Tax=Erysipelothrix sp. HDW6C TaxID=2714930 RepID=UPI00140B4611|nr:ATP-binding cassette domain-containing protein [Erysipelothrix sp. HDW6C]QIK69479.1 AAA family ATPase [Erysipelothrix sp. HDW6C]